MQYTKTSKRGPGAVLSRLGDTLKEWVEEFVQDMRRRGLSDRSQVCYRYDLLMFVKWVEEQPDLKQAGDLTQTTLENYQVYLMLRPSLRGRRSTPRTMSAGSRNRHLAELKSFFRFLKRASKLLGNPCSELEGVREPRRLPKAILSVPEMARLLTAIPKDRPSGLRDWAAVELLYGCGIRRKELVELNLTDLRLGEELVHILGKGNRERVVPIGKAACQALEAYLKKGRPLLARGTHRKLFVSSQHGGPVTHAALLYSIREHAQAAGIKKAVSYHQFRHTCATHMLRGGADLRSIQTLLGHAHLNTTAIYTRVEVSDLRKTLKECHPRETHRPPSP